MIEITYKREKWVIKTTPKNVIITDPEGDFIVVPKAIIKALAVII